MSEQKTIQSQPGLRLLQADRTAVLSAKIIDDLVESNHVVRVVWGYCLKLDLSPLYENIRTLEDQLGRPPYDPKILFAL